MSFKKVLSLVDGQVIDQKDDADGIAPSVDIADAGVYDTEISDFTGDLTIDAGDDSTIASCHVASGTQVIALSGSAEFNASKDNASTINVYVEDGSIQIQNNTGGSISVSARL